MRVEMLNQDELPAKELIQRKRVSDPQVTATVGRVIANVQKRGDLAVLEHTYEFDKIVVRNLHITENEIQASLETVDPAIVEALTEAGQRIYDFHAKQKREGMLIARDDGALVGTKISPIDSVGVYVPGGKALYPSTALMCAIPARVAGVRQIIMATPPNKEGGVDPVILAAAAIAGVNEIIVAGGAQAIAALAYGTETISAVDKIVGPGNAYVAAAKRAVSGDVGIDMIAGPSELAILADETSEPSLIALDLMAQAEHDPDAVCFLVTTDEELVKDVTTEIEEFLLDSPRAEITKQSLDNNAVCFVAPDLSTAISAINAIAPEHLEIQTMDPLDMLGFIDNAGAIFIGQWSPTAVGDYAAGPNHTLPTSGTARFSSPLSLDDFVKTSSVISYSYSALRQDSDWLLTLAAVEGLWAHGKSVLGRFELLETEDEDEDAVDDYYDDRDDYEAEESFEDDEEE